MFSLSLSCLCGGSPRPTILTKIHFFVDNEKLLPLFCAPKGDIVLFFEFSASKRLYVPKIYYLCTRKCPDGEMVDALVSGASVERRVGSSPILGTRR